MKRTPLLSVNAQNTYTTSNAMSSDHARPATRPDGTPADPLAPQRWSVPSVFLKGGGAIPKEAATVRHTHRDLSPFRHPECQASYPLAKGRSATSADPCAEQFSNPCERPRREDDHNKSTRERAGGQCAHASRDIANRKT